MSYAPLGALGDTASWLGVIAAEDEVYLWRVEARGVPLRSPFDALLFARAVGQALVTRMDVRGVAFWKSGGMGDSAWMIDVVLTSPESGIGIPPTASGILESVLQDADIRATFPNLMLSAPLLLELTGPQAAIDHWRSQPLLWDSSLSGGKGHGGPTDTFANPAEYSVVLGKADDGKNAKPWRQEAPALWKDGGAPASNTGPLLVGLIFVGVLGWALLKRKKARA